METPDPMPAPLPADAPLWYVSYGSNMSAARFACYLEGGRPVGGSHTNPGAHDPTPPGRDVPVDLPGTVYFAGDSRQWGGGVAFYDHETPGPSAARAYLVTASQFADIAAQEMHRLPDPGDPLVEVVLGGLGGDGERHHVGAGPLRDPGRGRHPRRGPDADLHLAARPGRGPAHGACAGVRRAAGGRPARRRAAGPPSAPRPTSGRGRSRHWPERGGAGPPSADDGPAPSDRPGARGPDRSEVDRAEHPRDAVRDLLVALVEIAGARQHARVRGVRVEVAQLDPAVDHVHPDRGPLEGRRQAGAVGLACLAVGDRRARTTW